MAGIKLIDTMAKNNNSANTEAVRRYVKDNRESLRAQCSTLHLAGDKSSRYRYNSHALWIELGVEARFAMITDFLNDIDGDSDLLLLSTVYLPNSGLLSMIAARINR